MKKLKNHSINFVFFCTLPTQQQKKSEIEISVTEEWTILLQSTVELDPLSSFQSVCENFKEFYWKPLLHSKPAKRAYGSMAGTKLSSSVLLLDLIVLEL